MKRQEGQRWAANTPLPTSKTEASPQIPASRTRSDGYCHACDARSLPEFTDPTELTDYIIGYFGPEYLSYEDERRLDAEKLARALIAEGFATGRRTP